jgi:hypothetical protein
MARLKWYLCVLVLLIFIIPSVSAGISVGNIIVTPSGDLVSGQTPPKQVSVSFRVNFIPESGVTFSDSNSLDMFTDLENAHWSYSIVLDDVANPPLTDTGKSAEINGWILSYPSRRSLSVLVNLTGDVPAVSATGKKTMIKVGVYNGVNEVYPGSAVIREANVILAGSPAVSTTAPASGQTPRTTVVTAAGTTPIPATTPVPPSSALNIPVGIITVIFLLISFIPLGLLIFHDYFGLGKLSIPQPFRVRAAIALVQVLCGISLLFVLLMLQTIYANLVVTDNGLTPVFVLLVLLLVSYVSLSAFALAIGSLLSKAFRWTLKVHSIAGIAVLVFTPVAIITLGSTTDRTVAIIIAIISALITAMLALLQDHALRDDLGSDWVSLIADFFQRVKGDIRPKKTTHTDTGNAIGILNTRLAKGEISLEEYNQLKEAIKK